MSLTTDVAWAAGLFEGEGSIILSRRRLSLEMKDEDVVRRFVAIVGHGNVRVVTRKNRVNRENHHTIYIWNCDRWAITERILLAFLPYLGERRRAKAEEQLADPAGPNGRPKLTLTEEALAGILEDRAYGGVSQREMARHYGATEWTVWRTLSEVV